MRWFHYYVFRIGGFISHIGSALISYGAKGMFRNSKRELPDD